jgi:hypothetical protein
MWLSEYHSVAVAEVCMGPTKYIYSRAYSVATISDGCWIDNWIYWVTHSYTQLQCIRSYSSLPFTITLAESSHCIFTGFQYHRIRSAATLLWRLLLGPTTNSLTAAAPLSNTNSATTIAASAGSLYSLAGTYSLAATAGSHWLRLLHSTSQLNCSLWTNWLTGTPARFI